MTGSCLRFLVVPILVGVATGASAQNKCMAKGQMGGHAFNLAYCEVAFYEGRPAATIWFSKSQFETLTGALKRGGKLSGRVTGAITGRSSTGICSSTSCCRNAPRERGRPASPG